MISGYTEGCKVANEPTQAKYRAWLLRQPCCCQPCVGTVIIHHSTVGETERHGKSLGGRRGKGQRASDAAGMPLCNRHHGNFHDLKGPFKGWEKPALRQWQNDQVAELHARFESEQPDAPTEKGKRLTSTSPAERMRQRIVAHIRARAGERRLKEGEAAVLSDVADEIEGMS